MISCVLFKKSLYCGNRFFCVDLVAVSLVSCIDIMDGVFMNNLLDFVYLTLQC